MSMGSFHPSVPHQNTPDTTLAGPHLSHSLHHFLVLHTLRASRNSYTLKQAWRGGEGRKGEKCLEITFGTRILYHTSPSHCFSHPGERKGLCSKPQSELTSEAGSLHGTAWKGNLLCCRKCLRKFRELSFNPRLTIMTEA